MRNRRDNHANDKVDEGPGEHDAHLMDDDETETVPCPRCGKYVWAYAQQCHHCHVHFSSEAWQFDTANGPSGSARWFWSVVIVLLVVVALLMITLY